MRALILVLLILFTTFISCTQDSRGYFEKIADVSIPASSKVTRDDYYKMGPGYACVLEMKLEPDAADGLLQSIFKSGYYKQIDTLVDPLGPMPLILRGKYKGLWYRNKKGYAFYGVTLNERDVITATFDTLTKEASFGIFAD